MPQDANMRPWAPGQSLSARRMNDFQDAVITSIRVGPGLILRRVGNAVTIGLGEQRRRSVSVAGGSSIRRLKVTAIQNDYIEAKKMDENGDPVGDAILVAKPPELRHDAAIYAGVTSITTVNSQEVTAEDGSTTETWVVKPPYLTSGTATEIWAVSSPGVLEVEIESEPVKINMIDLNVAGRVWGLDES